MTREDLIQFETEIADLFNAGKIRAPVHLYSGNEDEMLGIFEDVRPED
jgi:TPP-dependent pyruvate/acetoin dehydrogenase alpha subunit